MAHSRAQAWLTYATQSNHVPLALVLANSLRRTQTTRRIGCVVSARLTPKDHSTLRNSYDDIFFLNPNSAENAEETRAKIFAFSLEIFEKVVFLEPNSLLLENSDHLFTQAQGHIVPLMRETGGKKQVACDYFLLTPYKPFAEFLTLSFEMPNGLKMGFKDFLLKYTEKWTENNRLNGYSHLEEIFREEDAHLGNSVVQLSLTTGSLLKKDSWAPPSIVQLTEGHPNLPQLTKQVQTLLAQGQLALTERAILTVWLKLASEQSSDSTKLQYPEIPTGTNEPIAIVGLSCRLPGVNNLEEFWNMLYAGQSAARPPPQFRWKKEHVITVVGEKERSTHAGFLNSTVDEFDAKFFGVSPKEARFMDPQTRLLHEVLWESLESSGVDPSSLHGSHTGIYTGSWLNDYRDIMQCSTSRDFFRTYMGTSIGAGAARLSFLLGLTGPCIATESGCSSAIVAVDMAVKSLRCGETNLALAGGVNLLLHPFTSKIMDYVIAPDGKCKTFDAKADGFGRAEGAGFLVLKRLSDALKDRDNIWGLIRGSAVSQEGISRSLGTPTVHCEALAMKLALKDAGIRPEEVTFVETHGTGTAVGDPMEVAAIAQAYNSKWRKEPLIIGSVKTNVGHTESCSGITGIIKTILSMQHDLIPKHLNLDTLNPNVNLELIPAKIPLEAVPWPKIPGKPRLAGVSSFGITGTDGHVIIQEAPGITLPKLEFGLERPLHILKISGKTKESLEDLLKKHLDLFQAERQEDFKDVAFTANVGRAGFDHRAFIIASGYENAVEILSQGAKVVQGEILEQTGKLCFLFTGQGSQYAGMSRSLYESSPVFQFHFDLCDKILKTEYQVDIRKALWEESKELSRTIYSQTGIFVVEYCLLKLWQSWGLKPDFALGHSLGEFCAAVASGILGFEDALKLVAERSRLIDNLPRGSMLVLKASKQEVEEVMKGAGILLDFAAMNSPEQTVVAGDTDKIQELLKICKGKNMKGIILEATHAFHSKHMDPMLEKYRKIAQGIKFGKGDGECQYISGMEGGLKENVDAEYWVRHTREPVNFLGACQTLKENGVEFYLEVGPQPVLSTFVMQNLEGQKLQCVPSLRKGQNEWETILTSLGKLWVAGYKIDWNEYDKPYPRNKVDILPFYPFQRKSFWVDVQELAPAKIHPLVGAQMSNASNLSIYQNDLNVAELPYLKDHCIGNRIVFPGAGFTEMCLSAGYVVSNFLRDGLEKLRQPLALENVRIETPLELKEGKPTRLQVIVDLPEKLEGDEERHAFRCKVFHRNLNETEMGSNEKWVGHATAEFYPIVGHSSEILLKQWNAERIKEIMEKKEPLNMEPFYKRIDGVGLKFGETFRSIQRNWNEVQEEFGLDEVVAEVKVPENVGDYLLHPLILDAMFQAQILAGVRNSKTEVLRVPVKVGRLVLFNTLEGTDGEVEERKVYIHAKWLEKDKCQVWVCTENMEPLALVEEVELLETNMKTIMSVLESQNSDIPECWEELWKPISGAQDNRLTLVKMLEEATQEPDFNSKLIEAAKTSPEDPWQSKMVEQLVTLYAYRALAELGWQPNLGEELTAKKFCLKYGIKAAYMEHLIYHYFSCFQDQFEMLSLGANDAWKVAKLPFANLAKVSEQIAEYHSRLLQCDNMRAVALIYENVAKHLPKVLTGETNPLTILFPTDPQLQHLSAEDYYQVHPAREEAKSEVLFILMQCLGKLRSLPENQDPKKIYRVLEVGAGTGSLSQVAFEELKTHFGSRFEYYYTDVSQSFFAKAEIKFEEYKSNIKFAVFNIEENPLVQGIPVNYFDMVLATDVLHATRDLKECLANLRLVLRPKGQLTFTETITKDKGITSVFGLLEGYWRFEDKDIRPHHSCVGGQQWKKLLIESGFDFVHLAEGYLGMVGVISGTASELNGYEQWSILETGRRVKKREKRWILFVPEGDMGRSLMEVGEVLKTAGFNVEMVYWKEEMEIEGNEKISKILEGSKDMETVGVIYGWGMENGVQQQERVALPFMHLAKWLLKEKKPPRLYVLTRNAHGFTEQVNNPNSATLFGMAKSLKNENSDAFLRIVDFSEIIASSSWKLEVDQLLYELAMCRQYKEKERIQICYRNKQRYEPRLNRVHIEPRSKSELQLPPSTDRFQLALPKSRVINDLEFIPMAPETLEEGELELKVHAFALNFRDIFAILKPSPEFEKINSVGLDYSGVITRLGPGESKWKVGDRVFGANFKDYQLPSHLVTKRNMLLKIPDGFTFAEMSTLPAVFSTSIHCLLTVAKITKEDTVLIHTGSGGVGLSAIQLAKYVGAKIITTAGSPRKRAYLKSLGIEHVFHSRDTSYHEEIMRVTNGRGVDIVLNSITGPGMKEASLASCAKNARFVEMSKLAVWSVEEVKSRRPDVQYWIVDLTGLENQVWNMINEKMTELMCSGHVTSIPFVKFDALRIRQALQFFQKAKHIGKVVVTMPEVKAEEGQWKVKVNLFDSDSTYMITGGLGGIGFEVCKWMLEKGATDIVLIGRSPPKPEIQAEIEKLNSKRGTKVTVLLGDVGDFEQCKQLVETITQSGNFKTLRGIQHCAGVLKDNIYENQTWSTFEATFNPKIKGTWNLHNLTRDLPLEHFVLYSSFTALVGTPAQANHAAANCFEDAFAHYRFALGLPATTINWGQWAQVGCAKELNVIGILPVTAQRMLNGLEEALRSQRVQLSFCEFEDIHAWTLLVPTFKHYLDERLLKSLSKGGQDGVQVNLQSTKFWQEIDAADGIEGMHQVVTGYMKAVLRNALRMDPDEPIKDDANMQDLGVDSLMLIELRNSIQSLLGSRLNVTANMLKDCNTIRQLATVIVNKIVDQGEDEEEQEKNVPVLNPEEYEKLLREDCVLEEELRPKEEQSGISGGKFDTVLVTGATGQLGPYIMARLCKMEGLKKIWCLVRCREGLNPEEKLAGVLKGMGLTDPVDMAKVECVRGDLVKDRFGLEKQLWEKLSLEVNCVMHLAAKSNHVEHYRKVESGNGTDVRSANLDSTRNVIKFAVEGRTKSIFYASSMLAIFGQGEQEDSLPDSWPEFDDARNIAQAGVVGYPASKFVCEMLLKQLQDRGVPVKIFRLPWIMGDSKTGRLNFHNNHYILRFLTYLKLKAILGAPLPAIVLPVDVCADWSIRLFWDQRAPCGVYNVMHPRPQMEVEFVNVAKEEFDTDLEIVDWESSTFVEKMYSTDMPLEALKELYKDLDKIIEMSTSDKFQSIKGYLLYPDKYFRNEKVARYIPDMENGLPSTMETLRKDLVYVKSTGFFSKFAL